MIAIVIGAIVAAIVAILCLIVSQILSMRRSRQRIRYIQSYTPEVTLKSQFDERDIEFNSRAKSIHSRNETLEKSKLSRRLRLQLVLRQGGVTIALPYFLGIFTASVFLIALIINLAGPIPPLALTISLLFSTLSLRSWLKWRIEKGRQEFEDHLPDFLIVLSSSLRSGLPLIQSLETISHRGNGLVEREMRQAASDIALGVDPSSALLGIAKRMQSVDMSWVVLAIAIQRDVGGNLSTILESVAETVLQRGRVQREVRTLSAESRLSAVVLVALPIAVFIFFYFTRRSYVAIFWTTNYGIVLSCIMVLLAIIGIFWMRRIVKIKV